MKSNQRKQSEKHSDDTLNKKESTYASKRYYQFDKEEFAIRIQDVKAFNVPDFGYDDYSLFEEISAVNSVANQQPKSKWKVFYDAIRKYPKFEMLKNFIEEAKIKKKTDEE